MATRNSECADHRLGSDRRLGMSDATAPQQSALVRWAVITEIGRVVVEAETSYTEAQTEFNAALADLELAMGTVTGPY